jgi:DNA gyrase/topoisomerase IV subunit B
MKIHRCVLEFEVHELPRMRINNEKMRKSNCSRELNRSMAVIAPKQLNFAMTACVAQAPGESEMFCHEHDSVSSTFEIESIVTCLQLYAT